MEKRKLDENNSQQPNKIQRTESKDSYSSVLPENPEVEMGVGINLTPNSTYSKDIIELPEDLVEEKQSDEEDFILPPKRSFSPNGAEDLNSSPQTENSNYK